MVNRFILFNSKKEDKIKKRWDSFIQKLINKDLRVKQEFNGKEVESQTWQEESKNFILLFSIVVELGCICHDTFIQFLLSSGVGSWEKGRKSRAIQRTRGKENERESCYLTYPTDSSLLESIPAQVSGWRVRRRALSSSHMSPKVLAKKAPQILASSLIVRRIEIRITISR